ncbi:hypothetical protein B0H16DRAFT_1721250 [Mycena metata]|uniref:Uncharacterized protein n=1 Tax=Mycena metata TaxID=1033252 RepID=A0AAD7J5P7_9AGAR|nr:hypothetical protein B0H16DRAFT_1721250 [Mycena metata]
MSLHEGPLNDPPFVDAEDKAFWGWYYNPDAGGMELPFPKYRGQPMHSVDIPYLEFCATKTKRRDFVDAFEKYHAGLLGLIEGEGRYDYEEFRVPFGRSIEQDKPLRKCRDQKWLRWCAKKQFLLDKHPLFFLAVDRWLAKPQKFERTRDVGELLSASQYEDELNLTASEALDTYDLEHEFDSDEDSDGNLRGFVVSDKDPLEVDTDDGTEELDELEKAEKKLKIQRKAKRKRNRKLKSRPTESSESSASEQPPAKKTTMRVKRPSAKKSKRKRKQQISEGILVRECFPRTSENQDYGTATRPESVKNAKFTPTHWFMRYSGLGEEEVIANPSTPVRSRRPQNEAPRVIRGKDKKGLDFPVKFSIKSSMKGKKKVS